jgi:hypothetical protein
MSTQIALTPISEPEYEAIEAAVMETERGRWFLKEYFRRNRNADTNLLLEAITRLEHRVEATKQPLSEPFNHGLLDMAKTIEHTKSTIGQNFEDVLHSTEKALTNVEEAIERIQEASWALREEGAPEPLCDDLDRHASDIHNACQFQDRANQRLSKIVTTLRHLEERINIMLSAESVDKKSERSRPVIFLQEDTYHHESSAHNKNETEEDIQLKEENAVDFAEPYIVESFDDDKEEIEIENEASVIGDFDALKNIALEMGAVENNSIFCSEEIVFVDAHTSQEEQFASQEEQYASQEEQHEDIIVSLAEEPVDISTGNKKLDDPFFINVSEYDLLNPRERLRRFT